MGTESKNHHYNPQSVLKRFSLAKNQVITLDKLNLKTFSSPVTKTGSENYFNTIRFEDGKINFETLFDINDSILSNILDSIIENEGVSHLSKVQLKQLASVIAHQIIRTKRARTETADYIKRVNEFTIEMADEMNASPSLLDEYENEEEEKLITIIKLQSIEEIIQSLLEKNITFINAKDSGKYLWTSDSPVVMNNSFPYGKIGLNQKGIEIYYPISKHYAIGYFCKSTVEKYRVARKGSAFLRKLLNTLETKGTFTIDDRWVNLINHLQIVNSSRFVYAPANNFETKIEFLKKNERFRSIKSNIGFGKEVSTLPGLPKGHVFVFYTKTKHFMITASEVISEDNILIKSTELNKFILMTNDDPVERFEYYQDQNIVRGMADPEIVNIDPSKNELILGIKDPIVKFLIDMVKNKKRN